MCTLVNYGGELIYFPCQCTCASVSLLLRGSLLQLSGTSFVTPCCLIGEWETCPSFAMLTIDQSPYLYVVCYPASLLCPPISREILPRYHIWASCETRWNQLPLLNPLLYRWLRHLIVTLIWIGKCNFPEDLNSIITWVYSPLYNSHYTPHEDIETVIFNHDIMRVISDLNALIHSDCSLTHSRTKEYVMSHLSFLLNASTYAGNVYTSHI